MNKTIEEAAREFAALKTVTQAGMVAEREKKALLVTQFFHFAKDNLPLSERLNDEEKESIRAEYWQAVEDWIGVGDARGYCKTCAAMERIFGKEMFEKEEE